MKTRSLTFGLLAILFAQMSLWNNVSAQEKVGRKLYGGAGYFMMGYSRVDMQEMNARLLSSGYPEVSEGSLFLGGGGHAILGRVLIGGEGGGVAAGTYENGDYRISSSGGYGFFNLGYVLMERKGLLVYPLAGPGFGGMSLTFTDRHNLPDAFDDLLADPARQAQMTHGGFMMNFSLGMDWFVGGRKSDQDTGGWVLGLKAGYVLDTARHNWAVDKSKLSGAPAAGMSGFYVRLTIGGGGFVMK